MFGMPHLSGCFCRNNNVAQQSTALNHATESHAGDPAIKGVDQESLNVIADKQAFGSVMALLANTATPFLAIGKKHIQMGPGVGLLPIAQLPKPLHTRAKNYVPQLLTGLAFRSDSSENDAVSNVLCLTFIPDRVRPADRIPLFFEPHNVESVKEHIKVYERKKNQLAAEIFMRCELAYNLTANEEVDSQLCAAVGAIKGDETCKPTDEEKKSCQVISSLLAESKIGCLGQKLESDVASRGQPMYHYLGELGGSKRALNVGLPVLKALSINPAVKQLENELKSTLDDLIQYSPKSDTVPTLLYLANNAHIAHWLIPGFDEKTTVVDQLDRLNMNQIKLFREAQCHLMDRETVEKLAICLRENGDPSQFDALKNIDPDTLKFVIELVKGFDQPPIMFTDAGDADPDDEAAVSMVMNIAFAKGTNSPIVIVAGKNAEDSALRKSKLISFLKEMGHSESDRLNKISQLTVAYDPSSFESDLSEVLALHAAESPSAILALAPMGPLNHAMQSKDPRLECFKASGLPPIYFQG